MDGKSVRAQHAQILCASYLHLTGRELIQPGHESNDLVDRLENAPFALLSHGAQADPIFNYGNKIALELFEMEWDEMSSPPYPPASPPNRSIRLNEHACWRQ